jgi:hypothetical protein
MDEQDAPEGNISIVSTCVSDSERLWDDIPADMGEAIIIHNTIIRDVIDIFDL